MPTINESLIALSVPLQTLVIAVPPGESRITIQTLVYTGTPLLAISDAVQASNHD